MTRVKLHVPHSLPFTTVIPIRIQDINYGGHLGHDALISLLHEARVRFLQQIGLHEFDASGPSFIMAYLSIAYLHEAHYGDTLSIGIGVSACEKTAVEFCYIVKTTTEEQPVIAEAITGMVCYNYALRKTLSLPETFRQQFEPYQIRISS